MQLHELFPAFFHVAACDEPEGGDRMQRLVVINGSHHCDWRFDLHADTLPEMLDVIWSSAAEGWIRMDQAVFLSSLVIRNQRAWEESRC
ncbi:MAG: hypothetical protein AB7V46_16815 [Thermomicrobiales bacterium]